MELAIVKYIKTHGLEKAIQDFNLIAKSDEKRVLLKYNQLSSPTIMSNIETQECRGLILEKDTWVVLSLAFLKFFNHGESNAHKIDWSSAEILEKLDGSLLTVYEFEGKWYVSTTGTIDGSGEVNNKNGTTFSDLFWSTLENKYNFDKTKLVKGYCYAFELCTPFNIVVKPHNESSATLLTIRCLTTLKELSRLECIEIAKNLNIPIVKSYNLNKGNIGTLLNTFEETDCFFEGYVVVDKFFNRVKVKSPKYLAIHHLKGKTAEHNILTIVKANEIEEFVATFKERTEELYRLKDSYDSLVSKLNVVWDELKLRKPKNIMPSEKKKYAEAVFEVCKKHEVDKFTGLYFGLQGGNVTSVEDYMLKFDDKILFKIL